MWSLCKVTNHGTIEQVCRLVEANFIDILVDNLDRNESSRELSVCLEALSNILNFGREFVMVKGENIFLTMFEKLGGVDKIESLQSHKSADVYAKALHILETFYEVEEPLR